MTDQTARRTDEAEVEAGQVQPPKPKPAAEANARPAAAAAPQALDLSEVLAREAAESKDRLLRALAEMENLRRRTEREVVDARQYAIASFARDVLAVADNMRRAIEAIGPELRAQPEAKALIDGVELTEREILKALEKNGVRKFEPKGERFDPNLHQAMFELPDPTLPSGSVAQVVQAGYMIGERMLRPALVGVVAKGGPKPGSGSAGGPAADTDDLPAADGDNAAAARS
jgi:molecular chaperone GrpE